MRKGVIGDAVVEKGDRDDDRRLGDLDPHEDKGLMVGMAAGLLRDYRPDGQKTGPASQGFITVHAASSEYLKQKQNQNQNQGTEDSDQLQVTASSEYQNQNQGAEDSGQLWVTASIEGLQKIVGEDIGLDILNEIQAEYKPLAKVEELEEQNYNQIDNVLNNAKPKKAERPEDRPSLRERLRSGRMKMEAEKRERNLLDPRHNTEKAI